MFDMNSVLLLSMLYSDIKTEIEIWTPISYDLLLYDFWYITWTSTEAQLIKYVWYINYHVCGSWVGTEIRPVELYDLDYLIYAIPW